VKKLVVYGAAHAYGLKVIEAANRAEPTWQVLGFLDDTPELQGTTRWGLPVLGGRDFIAELTRDPEVEFYTNVRGHWSHLMQVTELLDRHGCRHATVVDPHVDMNLVEIGRGCYISIGTLISADVRIGDFVSLFPNCMIGHDVLIESYASVSQMASIGSYCVLKARSFCGAGCVVLPERTVGRESVVGAGAVVTRDVPDGVRVFGPPAQPEGSG